MLTFIVIVVLVVFVAQLWAYLRRKKLASMSPNEREAYYRDREARREEYVARNSEKWAQQHEHNFISEHGPANPAMICPHCHEKGKVHTRQVKQKKGISGAKTTAALMTVGVSIFATGLSRKEWHTEAFCRNCSNTWVY